VDKSSFFFRIRKFDVSFVVESVIKVGTKESNGEFILFNFFFKSSTGQFLGWWSSLLENPGNNSISGSSSVIFRVFSVFEPFKSWETLNSKFFGNLLLFGCVNLSKEEWWVVFGKCFSSSNVLWSKFFTVSTPRGIEFNK